MDPARTTWSGAAGYRYGAGRTPYVYLRFPTVCAVKSRSTPSALDARVDAAIAGGIRRSEEGENRLGAQAIDGRVPCC